MRIIAHLDMDAFFAAVEERERPYLKGQPIAVGADPQGGKGRGVVSTANYPARGYGIRSATPIRKAWELSEAARRQGKPPVVFISGHFRKYGEVSKRVMVIVLSHLQESSISLFEKSPPALEQVSVDECYLDLSFAGSFEKAREAAERIKNEIRKKEKLTCSIGIGPNKLIAKIASDFKKPDGLTIVPPEQVLQFLESLFVRKIPGVGPKAEAKFAALARTTFASPAQISERFASGKQNLNGQGVKTVADARKLSEEKLTAMFGKWGSELYRKFRGEDDSPVVTDAPPAKSIGEQETLPEDSLEMRVLLPYLERQASNLVKYLTKDGFNSFRTIVLTVRFADFETVSRSRTLNAPVRVSSEESRSGEPTGSAEILRRHITQMFFPFLDRRENPRRKKIRLVGVRVEKLS